MGKINIEVVSIRVRLSWVKIFVLGYKVIILNSVFGEVYRVVIKVFLGRSVCLFYSKVGRNFFIYIEKAGGEIRW